MNDRKQHVVNMAHQLFINKGVQATSVQDILEYSGISKGTFYNYFSSKNELLMALFKSIYTNLVQERNELLIGQDPSDIEIFIKQIEVQIQTNRVNKSIALFEEVISSNDEELKQFIKQGQWAILCWTYERFVDLFGESNKHYLLDCAIMFMGILHHNLKFNGFVYKSNVNTHEVVRYSVDRIIKMVDEVAKSGVQLISPDILDKLFPENRNNVRNIQGEMVNTVRVIKKSLNPNAEQEKYFELLDFISDELLHSKNPRKFLIENVIFSLQADNSFSEKKELQKLAQLIEDFFTRQGNKTR